MLDALIGLLPALGGLLKDTTRRRKRQDERGQRAVQPPAIWATKTLGFLRACVLPTRRRHEGIMGRHSVAARKGAGV
jgi:hypothetical protein